ncbi:hypothetical protein ORF011R [Spotted knifejaw iridovirus]|nr:hypothetical protein ORF011R [Spotted knifejaw iridovirus]
MRIHQGLSTLCLTTHELESIRRHAYATHQEHHADYPTLAQYGAGGQGHADEQARQHGGQLPQVHTLGLGGGQLLKLVHHILHAAAAGRGVLHALRQGRHEDAQHRVLDDDVARHIVHRDHLFGVDLAAARQRHVVDNAGRHTEKLLYAVCGRGVLTKVDAAHHGRRLLCHVVEHLLLSLLVGQGLHGGLKVHGDRLLHGHTLDNHITFNVRYIDDLRRVCGQLGVVGNVGCGLGHGLQDSVDPVE